MTTFKQPMIPVNDRIPEIHRTLWAAFKEHKIYPDMISVDIPNSTPNSFAVEVHIEGDWKHDHLRLDKIMKSLDYIKTDEQEVGHSDEDSYNSIHYYNVQY